MEMERLFNKQPKQNKKRRDRDINQFCGTAGDSKKKTVLQPEEVKEKLSFCTCQCIHISSYTIPVQQA